MSSQYVLLQFGDNPIRTRFQDLEGRAAFMVYETHPNPNMIVRLTREAAWSQQHPGIMGPDNSFLYFGPENSPGYIIYGNNKTHMPMRDLLRQKKEGASTRYFTAQSGKEYKWKISPHRMECSDGRTTVAVWEVSHPEDDFHARLTIKQPGLSFVTEILTTLTLIRMAQELCW